MSALLALTASKQAAADEGSPPTEGLQFEVGAFGGVHVFADNLELGVADDPGNVPSPETGSIFGLRLALTVLPWISFEGEIGLIPSADNFPTNYTLYLMSYKAHALVHLMHGRLRPFVLAGIGAMQVASTEPDPQYQEIAKDTDFDFHAGAGVKYAVTNRVDLRVDGRLVFLPNTGKNSDSANLEFLAGASYKFGGHSEPPPPPAPPLVQDTDRDDIPDNVDKCPTEAEDRDGFQDTDGCPDPDNDADGIADALDKCPDKAETKNGIDDEDGCPEVDTDNDGIFGSADKCPEAAEDKDGFQDDDGCPDPDNDGDGVNDATDKCPKELETKNGFQDEDGCPDEIPAAVKKFTGVIKGINFKVNSADIQKSSFKLLGNAAKVMKEYGDLRMEISGHTSSEGDAAKNLKLSQDRSDAVRAYLISAGIAGERIVSIGFGSDKPLGDNKAKSGREQNRRIEFRLLTADDAKSTVGGPGGAGLEGKPAEPAKAEPKPAPKAAPHGVAGIGSGQQQHSSTRKAGGVFSPPVFFTLRLPGILPRVSRWTRRCLPECCSRRRARRSRTSCGNLA
ncbi:MAG: OmpA family protein [Deltaproteobacteria bacterium]|nr:OmpA family protein [Deltaproteobacteria bacterium]